MKEKQEKNSVKPFELGKNEANRLSEIEKQDIVIAVRGDFKQRAYEKRKLENEWVLNMNFLTGNQYCVLTESGVENSLKEYDWQERLVFNHISSLIESRCAKLNRVRPVISIRPASEDDTDINSSKVAKKILEGISRKLKLNEIIADATLWAEVTGTAFYKVIWNRSGGRVIGKDIKNKNVYEGEIDITCVSPFEIYPSSYAETEIEKQESIIHAKCFSRKDILEKYGVEVNVSEEKDAYSYYLESSNQKDMYGFNRESGEVLLIEKYEKPSQKFKNGRLTIVANDTLIYYGDLCFLTSEDGKNSYPFIKQESIKQVGNFFGESIIKRIIPVQRAYNALKNRKIEFLNRISMGVLAVEDGSVDIENLEEEGLKPGKVLVYRQGSSVPVLVNMGTVPNDFDTEEDRLLSEFSRISGVSEIMNSKNIISGNMSGVTLQLLLEQDETRLLVTSEKIKFAIKKIAEHILRLYKQFATHRRLIKITGENNDTEIMYFSSSDITSFDVAIESENELAFSPAQRKTMVIDLLKYGLLTDDNGKITERYKAKILEMLGFGNFENAYDIITLHIKKSARENVKLISTYVEADEIDNHELHIKEHKRFMLSSEFEKMKQENPSINKRFLKHILEHKEFMNKERFEEEVNGSRK